VLLAVDRADGRGDLAGESAGGGDLVEERLEDVVIAAINQCDANRGAGESGGGIDYRQSPHRR